MRAKSLLRCLGEELRQHREVKSWSQEKLAQDAGVHTNVVGRLERGKYNPSVLTLHAIATTLGVELDQLFSGAKRRA